MKILALSTAEQGASLAISDNGRLVCEEYWDAKLTHSKRLVSMVEHMIENRFGLSLEDIDLFAAARGPGSFTGLRIGISVIKGISYAVDKPSTGISSLDGIGYRFSYSSIPVCVMMDAKRQEVYSAVYKFKNGLLISKSTESVTNPEKVINKLPGPAIYAGSGSKAYKGLIKNNAKDPIIADELFDSISAGALIHSLLSSTDPVLTYGDRLVPSYIRKSDAELDFAEKQGC